MNERLQQVARDEILNGLRLLPEGNHVMFKRMYSHGNLDANIEDVVAAMPEDQLDRAMQQVERTLLK